MRKLENIKSINGRDFSFEITDEDSISVLDGGYIITPDGKFINIADKESHEDIFNVYLNKYLCNNIYINYELFKAISELTEYNHTIYFGIKTSDINNIYSQNGNNNGFGVFIFPRKIELLTNASKKACIKLISTNKSIFGNYEKIELHFNKMDSTDSIEKTLVLSTLQKSK